MEDTMSAGTLQSRGEARNEREAEDNGAEPLCDIDRWEDHLCGGASVLFPTQICHATVLSKTKKVARATTANATWSRSTTDQ